MTDEHDIRRRPNRIPWPPIIYLLAIFAAFVLETRWPAAARIGHVLPYLRVPGVLLAALGLGLDLTAMVAMHRQQTGVLPHRGARRLVIQGPFAWSRNPIYLGNSLLLAGVALALPWPWLLACLALTVPLVDHLAIRREERHLLARFGEAWLAYSARVPRWIGWPQQADIDRREHQGE